MKRVFAILLGILMVFSVASYANALVVLNFDDLAGGSDIKDTFYQDVYFSTPDAQTIHVFVGNELGAGSSSAPNSISADYGEVGMGTIRLDFSGLVNFVGATGGDQGGDQDSFTIEVYNSLDNLLASASSGIFGGNALVYDGTYGDSATVGIGVADIAYALLIPTSPSNLGMSWDDISYELQAAPEPATLLLLGTGLVGLAGLRRKFRM